MQADSTACLVGAACVANVFYPFTEALRCTYASKINSATVMTITQVILPFFFPFAKNGDNRMEVQALYGQYSIITLSHDMLMCLVEINPLLCSLQ